jgi:hypothetical protein
MQREEEGKREMEGGRKRMERVGENLTKMAEKEE